MRLILFLIAFHIGFYRLCSATTTPKLVKVPSEDQYSQVTLTDQDGKPFQLHSLKGKYVFLSFIYTTCPIHDMCPKTMSLNRSLLKKWKSGKKMAPLHILIVTLDPKKDSPTVLKKYASQYNLDQKNVTLVTGALKSLSDFASEFNVVGIPGRGTISHNIRSILLGPDLKPLKKYDENSWTADQVLSDIEKSSHKLG